MADLHERLKRRRLADGSAVLGALREHMVQALDPVARRCEIPPPAALERPFVVLVVGVNGVGKTTTIGKLAHRFGEDGYSVMLAAGDTFRAAAIDQIRVWGERNGVPVIAQQPGADSAAVVFDALQAATARSANVLIADTAGRLHTKTGLMDELVKVRRVLGRIDPAAPHETLLVLDATTGQNGLVQARRFTEAVQVSGLAVTKLDGTARGGVLFAIARELAIPIRYIGGGRRHRRPPGLRRGGFRGRPPRACPGRVTGPPTHGSASAHPIHLPSDPPSFRTSPRSAAWRLGWPRSCAHCRDTGRSPGCAQNGPTGCRTSSFAM